MESDDESYQNAQYLSQDEEEETTIDYYRLRLLPMTQLMDVNSCIVAIE